MEEHADARGEVGVWQHECDDEDADIFDRESLINYVDKYGRNAALDQLGDWPNSDLADFILGLAFGD